MELFLHIGTNKTASSYLQTLQTKNKEVLESEGLYVPPSKFDKEMLVGKITPGNGCRLANILCLPQKRREAKLLDYFHKTRRAAQQNKCDKVCLSNEVLVRLFSNEELIHDLCLTANKAGFVKINVFCFLRNPYEHALSLYKHRMKSGKIMDYSTWLEINYKTLPLFQLFLQNIKNFKEINWVFRVYKKDPAYMAKVYFNEFLGVKATINYQLRKPVNPSMTLKGIKIMSMMENNHADAGANFYRQCMGNNIKISEADNLEQKFFLAYKDYKNSKFPDMLDQIAGLLPVGEQAEYVRVPLKETVVPGQTALILNEIELEAVFKTFFQTKQKGVVKVGIGNLKRLKAKYFSKKSHFDAGRYGGALRKE